MRRSLTLGLVLGAAAFAMPAFAQHDHHSEGEAPLWSQADEIWGAEAMEESRNAVLHHHGRHATDAIEIHRFELQSGEDEDVILLDGDVWYGGDVNKLVVKTEAEYSLDHNEFEEIEVQALWSRAISPYLDVQAGIRHDFEPDGLSHAVLGLEGMLPYRFDMDGAFFLSEEGDLTAGVEVEYELMLTQRLHILPRAELGWSAQDVPERGTGEGFTNGQLGVRLAYDVVREFAPFVGVEWQGSLGETENILSAAGEDTEQTVFVIGFHAWY